MTTTTATETKEGEGGFSLSRTPEPKRPPPSRYAVALPVEAFHKTPTPFSHGGTGK